MGAVGPPDRGNIDGRTGLQEKEKVEEGEEKEKVEEGEENRAAGGEDIGHRARNIQWRGRSEWTRQLAGAGKTVGSLGWRECNCRPVGSFAWKTMPLKRAWPVCFVRGRVMEGLLCWRDLVVACLC